MSKKSRLVNRLYVPIISLEFSVYIIRLSGLANTTDLFNFYAPQKMLLQGKFITMYAVTAVCVAESSKVGGMTTIYVQVKRYKTLHDIDMGNLSYTPHLL